MSTILRLVAPFTSKTLLCAAGCIWLSAAPLATAVEPEPIAVRMIERLSLPEMAQPLRDDPRWRKPDRIGVTVPPWLASAVPDAMARFRRAAGDAEVVEISGASDPRVAELEAIVNFCSSGMLEAADNLLWLHNYTVGVERCTLLPNIEQQDFILTNAQRTSGPTIAEHVIGLMMALTRSLQHHHANQMGSRWERGMPSGMEMFDVEDKTMLVVGLGGIGTEVARRAAGLGMRVIATRRSGRVGPDYVEYVGLSHELLELASRADVIVNALPLTDETRFLFNEAFFDAVKPGAYFISVGRGASTVTADLVAALKDGRLRGAGLDVTDPEPLPSAHELWRLPNVIITPHVSSQTRESRQRMVAVAIENVRRYAQGGKLLNVVDLEAGY